MTSLPKIPKRGLTYTGEEERKKKGKELEGTYPQDKSVCFSWSENKNHVNLPPFCCLHRKLQAAKGLRCSPIPEDSEGLFCKILMASFQMVS